MFSKQPCENQHGPDGNDGLHNVHACFLRVPSSRPLALGGPRTRLSVPLAANRDPFSTLIPPGLAGNAEQVDLSPP